MYSCTLCLTSALAGVGGQRHAPASLPQENPVTIVQAAWCAPGPVWTGAENLAPTGIRSRHWLSKVWISSVLGPHVIKDAVFRKALLIHFKTNRWMMCRETVAKGRSVLVLRVKQFRISVHHSLGHNVTESTASHSSWNHILYFWHLRNLSSLVTGDKKKGHAGATAVSDVDLHIKIFHVWVGRW